MKALEKLQKMVSSATKEDVTSLSRTELEVVIGELLDFLTEVNKMNRGEFAKVSQQLGQDLRSIQTQLSQEAAMYKEDLANTLSVDIVNNFKETLNAIENRVNARLAELKDGEDGISPDIDEIVEKVTPLVPQGSPDTPEQVRDKLETLQDDNRLSIKAISGLDDELKKVSKGGGGGHHLLSQLMDVDVVSTAPTNTQALVWNATLLRWVPGSGGTSTFLGLTDTPSSFSGEALKVARVNAGETALEFVTLAGGGDALTADPLSQFAATTSAQLAGVISDETGSGALVFGTSPTIATPTLTLKQSAAPTPTAEGDIQWDTDDNTIKIGDGTGTKTFSDDSVNAATYQPLDSDLTTIAAANNGTVLANTTASFTTADETKLDGIEALADVTDATNVISALNGASITTATVATGDKVLVQDADDTDNLKTVTAQSIANLNTANVSKVGTPVDNQIGVWTGDGTIEGDAALTFDTADNTMTLTNGQVSISVANTINAVPMELNQNDTTNNPDVLQINNAGTGGEIVMVNTNAGAAGAYIEMHHNSASPAASDTVGQIAMYGEDSGSTKTMYGRIITRLDDPTDTSEDSSIVLSTFQAGAQYDLLTVGGANGTVAVGSNSGGASILESRGNTDLTLQTGNATTGSITITDGANGNITLAPNGTGIVKGELHTFAVRLKDSTTSLSTGTTVGGDYRIPGNRAITVKAVGAYVDTAAATGSNKLTIDINEAGTTILSTKVTLDVGEKTSTTAATAAVISDTAIAADAIITFDIDQVNETTPAKGLVVWIEYVYA